MDLVLLVCAVVVLGAMFWVQSYRLAIARDRLLESREVVFRLGARLHLFWDDQMQELEDEEYAWAELAVCAMHDVERLIVASVWAAELEDLYGEFDYDLPFAVNEIDGDEEEEVEEDDAE